MIPTPYDDGKHDEPPLYLRLVSANNGLDVAAKLIIVDADGEPVDRGNVLFFDDGGRAFAALSIDPDAARRAGLTLDDKGRLEFRS